MRRIIFRILLQIVVESGLFARCIPDKKNRYITLCTYGVVVLRDDFIIVVRGRCKRTGDRVFKRIDIMDPHSFETISKTLLALAG